MINLSNYEEYFLLYIDNELNKKQCAAVAAFVLQHPHLAAELDMLQAAKLPQEDAVLFTDKSSLYKMAGSSINATNYEEYFLLHTDKELSATQAEEVAQFVLQHPQLQEEFLLVQRAKLTPENMECPDKHRLYKQPGRRVIPLYITRIAVAAAVLGVIALAGNSLINNSNELQPVAINTQQNRPVKKAAPPQKETKVMVPEKKSTEITVIKNETKEADKVALKSIKDVDKKPALINKSEGSNSNDKPVITPVNSLPEIQQTAPEVAMADENTAPKHQPATTLKPLEEITEKEDASTVMYVSNDYATTKPTVYKELNTDEDNQTLYVGSLQLNKAKVNGLLKKATHLLGSKAKEQNL